MHKYCVSIGFLPVFSESLILIYFLLNSISPAQTKQNAPQQQTTTSQQIETTEIFKKLHTEIIQ